MNIMQNENQKASLTNVSKNFNVFKTQLTKKIYEYAVEYTAETNTSKLMIDYRNDPKKQCFFLVEN